MSSRIIKELNSLATRVITFWAAELTDEYMLYVNTSKLMDFSEDGIVFNTNDNCFINEIVSKIQNADNGFVNKIALFNKELFYYFVVNDVTDEYVEISVGLSSMIFGKSQLQITYARFNANTNLWILNAEKYHRGYVYNGYEGNIEQCLEIIFRKEQDMADPYESMYEEYPYEYERAMEKTINYEISNNGISVNNWFGI